MLLDHGVAVADGSSISGVEKLYILWPSLDSAHPVELELSLLEGVALHDEPALGIIQQVEIYVSLLDLDYVLEAAEELDIGADFAVDVYKARLLFSCHLHQNNVFCKLSST